ncbi:P-loop containing nucleoside triphosphate hydrolase protein [Trametes polyzona]|nr:P-loop containing nucleoside triphosphate hydrolase protein [Trametes polyzona]
MSVQSEPQPAKLGVAGDSQTLIPDGKQVVLVLVGLIGSGKSTFAEALERHSPHFRRCSQDELGDRRSVEALARRSLADGQSVCIDRTNFDESQRATWINIAHQFPQAEPWVIVFDTPYEICAARISERTGHPTITSPELGLQVLQRFRSQYRPPAPHEGYTRILYLTPSDCPDSGYTEADVWEVMRRLRESPEVVRVAPPPFRQSGYRHGGSFQHHNPRGRGRGFQPRGRYAGGGLPSSRGGSYARGGHRGGYMYQSTLPWARQGEESSSTSAGSGYEHASDARRSGYQDGSRPEYDRTQENWKR